MSTVWIVCNEEIYASKENAIKTVKRCLMDGVKGLKKDSNKYRIMKILLDADIELALDYWNNYAHTSDEGTGAPISFRETSVRP